MARALPIHDADILAGKILAPRAIVAGLIGHRSRHAELARTVHGSYNYALEATLLQCAVEESPAALRELIGRYRTLYGRDYERLAALGDAELGEILDAAIYHSSFGRSERQAA